MKVVLFKNTFGSCSIIGAVDPRDKPPAELTIEVFKDLTPLETEMVQEDVAWFEAQGTKVKILYTCTPPTPLLRVTW